ncbi:uncharacterized protein B0H18DRAFT_858501, partial [Fomitopsis serialis]|uniref:uncharacterized protein n=1 Tax=Fomitopsis serialis TaxID=139415 RepID=UPI002007FFDC
FINTADDLFGPITTLRAKGKIVKRIPWSSFKLKEQDWEHVKDVVDILKDANDIHQLFSYEKSPTLWRVLPAFEDLLTRWEGKRDNPKFQAYKPGLDNAIKKLHKYYCALDRSPVYVLALVLHPYYKLDYIESEWGGEEERQEQWSAGNFDAKNWKQEARKIVENTV